MLRVVHYCYRFLCTVVTISCARLLPISVHSLYHFLCTRGFCLHSVYKKAACNYYDQCVRAGRSSEFDELCPIYKSRMELYDYYRISNSNIIEVDSFLDGARYPSLQVFTTDYYSIFYR